MTDGEEREHKARTIYYLLMRGFIKKKEDLINSETIVSIQEKIEERPFVM